MSICAVLLALLLAAGSVAGCSEPDAEEAEVVVGSVGIDPQTRAPVVILESADHKAALPIWIGPAEARAIAEQLDGIEPPRPGTHDLMKDALERSGVTLRRVVIDELRGNTYHAHLVLQSGGRDIEIDCRPSDGIALAVRFERPIFVHTPLLASQSGLARAAGAEVGQMAGLTVQNLTPDLAGHFGFAEGQSGVVVADVDQGGSSALRRGDVIVEVDGAPVVDVSELRRALNLRGTKSHLTVRRDGAFLRLSMAAPGASR